MIKFEEAMPIVCELARQKLLDQANSDEIDEDEYEKKREAVDVIEDYIVNQLDIG